MAEGWGHDSRDSNQSLSGSDDEDDDSVMRDESLASQRQSGTQPSGESGGRGGSLPRGSSSLSPRGSVGLRDTLRNAPFTRVSPFASPRVSARLHRRHSHCCIAAFPYNHLAGNFITVSLLHPTAVPRAGSSQDVQCSLISSVHLFHLPCRDLPLRLTSPSAGIHIFTFGCDACQCCCQR